MKKIITALTVLLAFTLATTACEDPIPAPKPIVTPEPEPEPKPEDKTSISILAIGNSFSVDAMQYLYGFLKEAGYENINLGNLYIGGCSLQTHAGHFKSNNAAYTYYTNSTGKWSNTTSHTPLAALTSREWDIITMQQASGNSGETDSFEPYLGELITIVKEKCPKARLMWHMTWAYQGNSTHKDFPKYGSNQMTMYNAILTAVKTRVQTKNAFEKIIPCGTTVQNLRTSFIGDNITRDGYHMAYNIGRMATAMTWAHMIGGLDIDKSSYRPEDQSYTEDQVLAIKDAVKKACAKPFEITESDYKTSSNKEPETLDEYMTANGYDLSTFERMSISFFEYAYYNSGNASWKSTLVTKQNSTATNLDNFAATPIYEKKDLPEGSVIVVLPGWQYRPEGWTALGTSNSSSSRPGNVTKAVTKVDSAWWGSWNYRAFNLSKTGTPALTAADMKQLNEVFAVYIPKK